MHISENSNSTSSYFIAIAQSLIHYIIILSRDISGQAGINQTPRSKEAIRQRLQELQGQRGRLPPNTENRRRFRDGPILI